MSTYVYLCPITVGPYKKSVPILLTSPLLALEGLHHEVSPELDLLHTEQSQLSQSIFIGEVLLTSGYFCGPPLDLLKRSLRHLY